MKIIVVGATGTVGAEVVREALADLQIEKVIALVRRSLDLKHPKLEIVEHQDYLNYSSLYDVFKQADGCIWCLGVSQSQVDEVEYMKITHDYTLAAAKALLAANPNITFLFLSGAGADPSQKSGTSFARGKGKTENSLMQLAFKKLFIARPAGIQPIHINKNTALVNKIVAPFYPILKIFVPHLVITSVQLAKAMLSIVKKGYPKVIVNNKELKELVLE